MLLSWAITEPHRCGGRRSLVTCSQSERRSRIPLAAPLGRPLPAAQAQRRETALASPCYTALQLAKQSDTCMTNTASRFGFVEFAETWNGRLAMLGFVIGLATELLTGQGILQQIGLG